MKITDLILWRSFLTVAQTRNFSKAATALRTNAPNVTKRISMLESQLGVRLFNRTTRVVSLTQEGEGLLPYVQLLLDQAKEIEDRAEENRQLSGRIRVTCLEGLSQRWLAPALVKFQKQYPEIRFDILPTDRLVDLVQEQVDLAVRIQEPRGSDYVFKELRPNNLVVCASPAYLKKKPELKKPADLHRHSLLMLEVHRELRFMKTGERLGEFTESRKIVCESGPYLTELAVLGAGVGIRAAYEVSTLIQSGKLVRLLENHPLEYFRKVYLVIPQRRYLSSRVRAFADFLMSQAELMNI